MNLGFPNSTNILEYLNVHENISLYYLSTQMHSYIQLHFQINELHLQKVCNP